MLSLITMDSEKLNMKQEKGPGSGQHWVGSVDVECLSKEWHAVLTVINTCLFITWGRSYPAPLPHSLKNKLAWLGQGRSRVTWYGNRKPALRSPFRLDSKAGAERVRAEVRLW